MENLTLKVEGMSCGHCVRAVESGLADLQVDASVDLESGQLSVQYDASTIDLAKIKAMIAELGYSVV